jgi:hypothetical protein
MTLFDPQRVAATRRRFLGQISFAGLAMAATPAWAEKMVKLPLPGGPDERPLTNAFPQKGPMILQRTRPAAVGDAFRGVRSWRVHAKRPILCALALGGHP